MLIKKIEIEFMLENLGRVITAHWLKFQEQQKFLKHGIDQ